MRPSFYLMIVGLCCLLVETALVIDFWQHRDKKAEVLKLLRQNVAAMGLSDLALSTEARYTRHPAVSDQVAPFMDHPAALEHFPSGSFFTPVP